MHKLPALLVGLLLASAGFGQVPNCHNMQEAPQAFAELGSVPEFVASHQNPGLFKLTNPQGAMITFPVQRGQPGNAYYIKPEHAVNNWILVFHEWYGLNDYVKFQAEKLADEFPKSNVLAIDLYDEKVATNRQEATALMQSMKDERARAIIRGAASFAGSQAHFATIGWCFGGGWSFQAALMLGNQMEACVMYYGMPVTDPADLKQLQAPVLDIFANKDGWITPKVVSNFKKAMDEAGKSLTVQRYDADHAFANPSNTVFNEEARDDAWEKTLTFLHKYLLGELDHVFLKKIAWRFLECLRGSIFIGSFNDQSLFDLQTNHGHKVAVFRNHTLM